MRLSIAFPNPDKRPKSAYSPRDISATGVQRGDSACSGRTRQTPFLSRSIPLDGIADAAPLVILQRIRQRRGIATEGEIIRCIRCQHHRRAHIEAMKVARQTGRGHAHGMVFEVVAA